MSPDDALRRARTSLAEAKLLADAQHWNGAVNRAYYAMFQAAQVLLKTRGIDTKTHRGLRIRLQEEHLLEREAVRLLAKAQELRQMTDYENEFDADADVGRQLVIDAEAFLEAVAERLGYL